MSSAVAAVNASLASSDPARTAQSLAHPALGLSVRQFAAQLYHDELGYVREGSKAGKDSVK